MTGQLSAKKCILQGVEEGFNCLKCFEIKIHSVLFIYFLLQKVIYIFFLRYDTAKAVDLSVTVSITFQLTLHVLLLSEANW